MKDLKKNIKFLSIGIIAVIFLSLIFVSGVFSVTSNNYLNGNDIYMQPLIGSFCCERASTRQISVDYTLGSWGWFDVIKYTEMKDTCSENVDQAGCTYSFKVDRVNLLGTSYVYEVKQYGSIIEQGQDDLSTDDNGKWLPSGGINIPPGASIDIKIYQQPTDDYKINFKKEFTPYHLTYQSPIDGKHVWNAQSCTVKSASDELNDIKKKVYKWQIIVGENMQTGQYKLYPGVIDFGTCYNYIASWSLAPSQFLPTLNGQQVACQGGKIYSIGTITLEGGTTIKVLDKIVGEYGIGKQYECCPLPGMATPDKVCIDWHWKDKATHSKKCTFDIECQQGQFTGGWSVDYMDPSGKTIVRGACENGVCNYRAETQEVECTSDGQCYGDTPLCDVGNTWKCVASTGGSISPGVGGSIEKMFYDWTQWLIYIIMTAIGAVFGYLMSKKDRIIWAVGGGLLGLVSAFVIQWIYNNWLILVIGGVLGGVGLYILGPTILAVVLIFVEIIKSMRGK